MSPTLDSIARRGQIIATIDTDDHPGHRAQLLEDHDEHRYLRWEGPGAWLERVDTLVGSDATPALPSAVVDRHPVDEDGTAAILLACPTPEVAPFNIWKWRNLGNRHCVLALEALAHTVAAIHRAGWSLDGIARDELLFDRRNRQVILAAIPRLQPLDGERETIWRDIRIFAALAYENFLEHEYPGGHKLVALLQDRKAMADTGITTPGLAQLLAGCVTPYGDLAYQNIGDLLDGLANLRCELTRPLGFRVGSRSTQGNHIFRQNNQDSCGHALVDTTCGSRTMRLGFFCVADGIGGIDDGERASALAVRTACSTFLRAWNHYDAAALQQRPGAFARSIAKITSQRLVLEGNFAPDNNRGGTTFTGLLLAGDRAGLCHVGDSRALLIRDAEPIALTRDHTLASILEALDEAPADEDANETNHRTIARFLSTGTELEWSRIDAICDRGADQLALSTHQQWIGGFELRSGDILLLTSDGAHGEYDHRALIRLVSSHHQNPQALCDALVDRSLEKIARDNATALAIFIQ